MKQSIRTIGLIVIGILMGAGLMQLWPANEMNHGGGMSASDEPEIKYWVAPMDPNYRRDGPGKSPMGMDLIPVYKEDANVNEGPGAVTISPEVVNNLGVRTAAVSYRNLSSNIRTVGYVKYDENRLLHLHPRVEGWIDKLHIKSSGDPIQKGQPVYELYSPELVNAQEELLLAMNRKNDRLIRAAEERLQALQLDKDTIAALKRDRKVRQRVVFRSPQSGVVDNLAIREGFFVKPGTTLMSVGALDEVWVEVEVFERQTPFIEIGQLVTMTLDYLPGRDWQGAVDYIYPTLDPKTRTVRVRLRFDNRDAALKPNMFAQVVIHAEDTEQVLAVPREALIRTGRQQRLVVELGEGRFKSIAVKTGRMTDNWIEITEGLTEDDIVVTSAQFLLDSESSKTSDFKRMHAEDEADEKPQDVWVEATIEELNVDFRMARITHQPIPAWDWPVMTMMFVIGEDVDIDSLKAGQLIHMNISQSAEGDYVVHQVHIRQQPEPEVDHSEHQMQDTNEEHQHD